MHYAFVCHTQRDIFILFFFQEFVDKLFLPSFFSVVLSFFVWRMSDREGNRQFGRNGRIGRPRSPTPRTSHVRQRPAELLAQSESTRSSLPPSARASSASPALDTRHRGDSSAARPHTHGGSPHGQPWRRRNGGDSRSPPPERTPLFVVSPLPPWLPPDTHEAVTFVHQPHV